MPHAEGVDSTYMQTYYRDTYMHNHMPIRSSNQDLLPTRTQPPPPPTHTHTHTHMQVPNRHILLPVYTCDCLLLHDIVIARLGNPGAGRMHDELVVRLLRITI
jgi:hypothetical protein